MRILLCSKLFPPSNSIGAVRVYNLAKYLVEFGHSVSIISGASNNSQGTDLNVISVGRIPNSQIIKRLLIDPINKPQPKASFELNQSNLYYNRKSAKSTKNNRITTFLLTSRRQLYNLIIEVDWYYQAKGFLKRTLGDQKFDLVISSFGPYGSYLLGKYVAKCSLANFWISDLRDIMPNQMYPFWLNLVYNRDQKYIVKNADAITVVSKGQALMLKESIHPFGKISNKIHVIYNGYEKPIVPVMNRCSDNILKISYTGDLYFGRRDIRLLFKVLYDLLDEKAIRKENIVFNYAGSSFDSLKIQMRSFPLVEEICMNWGLVNRDRALEIQKSSNILVVLTWNDLNDQGILTGKFQEYLQNYKPIISITQGGLPNGELTQIVREMRLGLACEYCDYNKSYSELKEYILIQYAQMQKGEPLVYSPDLDAMRTFHYEKIVRKFDLLCMGIYKKN